MISAGHQIPFQLLLGAKEVVKNVLSDSSILETVPSIPDLLVLISNAFLILIISIFSRLESNADRELGLLLWTNYSDDVVSEVLSCAKSKGLEGMTKVIVAHDQVSKFNLV